MGHHRHNAITPCPRHPVGRPCTSYADGHQLHSINLRLVCESPWGWRDAVITSVAADGWVDAAYLSGAGSPRLWHHHDLTSELPLGSPVRIHEGYRAVSGAMGIVNVAISGGPGPVPEPEHPETWAQERSQGAVDFATGRAVLMG